MAIIVAAAPNLTRQYEECPETYKLKLRRLLKIMVVMSVSTALILSIFSSLIIHLLYGPAYAEAAPLLTIQAWAGVFVAMSVASGPWFVNTGNMRYGLYQAIAGMITSICLNYLLIPVYGLAGAAASLVVSYAISTVLLNAFFRNTRALFLMQMQSFALR
jgi:O-antigen/teichoic acid export membrane protein